MIKFAGADWIKSSLKVEPSPLGCAVADLLGSVFRGIYHLDTKWLERVQWADRYYITIVLRSQELATWDFNELTTLVVLCHDKCLRMSISGAGPNQIRLTFHQRAREGDISTRHPTIEQAIEMARDLER